jgi:hypothetical protein
MQSEFDDLNIQSNTFSENDEVDLSLLSEATTLVGETCGQNLRIDGCSSAALPFMKIVDTSGRGSESSNGEESEHSCAVPLNDQQEPVHPAIAGMIRGLGSNRFAERDSHHQSLRSLEFNGLPLGLIAIPHLTNALSDGDAEIRRRAQLLVPAILGNVPLTELMTYRDSIQQSFLLKNGLGRMPSLQERETLAELINTHVHDRLRQPPDENMCEVFIRGKFTSVTQELVDAFSRFDSPEGTVRLKQRMVELSLLRKSPHLTELEREDVVAQRVNVSNLLDQREAHARRIDATILLGHQHRQTMTPEQFRRFVLDTYKSCGNIALRTVVAMTLIAKYELDQDPSFMSEFGSIWADPDQRRQNILIVQNAALRGGK